MESPMAWEYGIRLSCTISIPKRNSRNWSVIRKEWIQTESLILGSSLAFQADLCPFKGCFSIPISSTLNFHQLSGFCLNSFPLSRRKNFVFVYPSFHKGLKRSRTMSSPVPSAEIVSPNARAMGRHETKPSRLGGNCSSSRERWKRNVSNSPKCCLSIFLCIADV